MRDPMSILEGCDYSHFRRFEYAPSEKPDYLQRDHGLPEPDGSNVGKMVAEDFQFVDSKACLGVQVADLLATGFRRVLQCKFDDPQLIARRLGALMTAPMRGESPIKLIGSGSSSPKVSPHATAMIRAMEPAYRPMVL